MGPGQVCLSTGFGRPGGSAFTTSTSASRQLQRQTSPPDAHPAEAPSPLPVRGCPWLSDHGKCLAEPMAMGRHRRSPPAAVWHLLIREEFAPRAGLRQLVCCVLSCNRDAAGWHRPGPSDWAAVFGSSKSSALLEQRGIQDSDPTEDEEATGSQTPPPTPRGVWLEPLQDLETQRAGVGAREAHPQPSAPGGGG